MGCRIVPYWMATMAFDTMISFANLVPMIILFPAVGLAEFIEGGKIFIYYST